MCALFAVAAQTARKNLASHCSFPLHFLPCRARITPDFRQERMTSGEKDDIVAEKMQFIDSHCHLQDPRIRGTAGQLIREAKQVGVQWLVVNGTSEADWQAVKEMSSDFSEVIPSFGLHPWCVPSQPHVPCIGITPGLLWSRYGSANDCSFGKAPGRYVGGRSTDWLTSLRSLLMEVPGAAAGEAGLDKNVVSRSGCDMQTQEEVLKDQLRLALELHRPIALHCVKAYGRLYDIVKTMAPFPAGFILHSYGGPPDLVEQFSACGGYFSISGLITRLKEEKARGILGKIPHQRLLLETDSPDALPQVDKSRLQKDLLAERCETEERRDVRCVERQHHSHLHNSLNASCEDGNPSAMLMLNHPAKIVAVAQFVAKTISMPCWKVAYTALKNAEFVFQNQIKLRLESE